MSVEITLYTVYQIRNDVVMRYWLMKSEPESYSIDDLMRDKKTAWDGVRNYQARNFMRDDMRVGDRAFFYHSSTAKVGIYGLMEIASAPYADPTQYDKKDSHYDPQSTKKAPRWQLVDVRFVKKFKRPILLSELKKNARFSDMEVVKRGSRLSIQPVCKEHFEYIMETAE